MAVPKELPPAIRNYNFADLPESVRKQITFDNAYLGMYTEKNTGKTYMRLLIKNEDGKYFDYRNGGSPSEKGRWKTGDDWKRSLGLSESRFTIEILRLGEATPVKKTGRGQEEWFAPGKEKKSGKTDSPGTAIWNLDTLVYKAPKDNLVPNKNAENRVVKKKEEYLNWLMPVQGNIAIDLSNPRASLNALKQNPTFGNLQNYAMQLEGVRGKVGEGFYDEAKSYMLQYLVAQRAVFDAMQQEKNSGYTADTYGRYVYKSNDCYTWFKKVYKATYDEDYNTRKRPGNFLDESIGGHELEIERKFSLKNVEKLMLQVGDIVMVDKSPSGSGRNHWGVVVLQGGELKIAHRSDGAQLSSFDEFFKNTRGTISVARYGQPDYSQHFEVEVYRGKSKYRFDARVVDGRSPESFYIG